MKPIPLIRASQLMPFSGFLRSMGAPVESLMGGSRLPAGVLHDPDALIPEYALWAFIDKAARSQGLDDFGLRVAETSAMEDVGAFGELLAHAPTLASALDRVCRMIAVHSTDARFWLARDGDRVRFCREGIKTIAVGRDQVEQYTLMFMVNLVREAAGPGWWPVEVWLQAQRAPARVTSELFAESRIHYRQAVTALALPTRLLELPMRRLARTRQSNADMRQLESAIPPRDFTGSLQVALSSYLSGGYPDIGWAAEVAGVSVRTLQRRLSAAGISYTELVDQVRFQKAVRLLHDPAIAVTDIAYELAYTDPAHFTRACRRWTGVAPREFRRRNEASDST